LKTKSLIALVAALAALTLTAQEKKGKTGAILHPEMEVKNGSYDKPMATIGSKPTEPWTATTTAAGVNKKPEPGKPVTVVGEVVDFSCYLQLGKHGEAHRSCGQKCVQNGQPIGLLDTTARSTCSCRKNTIRGAMAAWTRRRRRRIIWGTSWK